MSEFPIDNPLNEGDIEYESRNVNSINPEDFSEGENENIGPLNPNEGEIVETEPDNEVETRVPELEKELTLIDRQRGELDSKNGPIDTTQVTSINPESNVDRLNDVSNVDISEYTENSTFILNDSKSNVNNEISNVQNQINGSNDVNSKTELSDSHRSTNSFNKNDILNSLSESTINDLLYLSKYTDVEYSNNRSNVNVNDSITNKNITNDDSIFATEDDIAMLKSHFGIEDDLIKSDNPNVSESNIINESIENRSSLDSIESNTVVNKTDSFLENKRENSVIDASESMEVSKSKIGIDKKVAPINTPTSIVEDVKSNIGESVTLTEVNTEKSNVEKEKVNESPSITNNETNNNSQDNIGYSVTDMSGVEARLRKIENLLSGPLEVKIID